MGRHRKKERCFCKEEEVYCRFANTNPTCIHYSGLRQCFKNCKSEFDVDNIKECHPSPTCGFECCYRLHLKNVGKQHCSVVDNDNKTILF